MTFVYIIGSAQGPCKFGVSADPARRVSNLQVGCPFELSVIYKVAFPDASAAYNAEQIFLRSWLDRHMRGEWFNVTAAEAIGVLNKIAKEEA